MTSTDLAIASLAAAVVFPDTYCRGEFYQVFHGMELQDPEFAADVKYWRDTELGEFVLYMHQHHRFPHG
jgi:hypothetical protein